MGERERFPKSLNAVNIVCFRIDWHERMLNVLNGHFQEDLFRQMKLLKKQLKEFLFQRLD
jgi:hypothetical protein